MAGRRTKGSSGKNSQMPDLDTERHEESDEPGLISLATVRELLKVQESTLKAVFQAHLEATNARFDQLIKEVTQFKVSLEFTQKEVDEVKASLASMETDTVRSKTSLTNLETECSTLVEKLDDLENRSRRNNICFDGIPESENETWEQTEHKLRDVISKQLKIDTKGLVIERAHRIGKRRVDKPRTAIAKLLNFKDKEAILKVKKNLKGTGIFVREDYSDLIMAKRRDLLPELREARERGHIAFIKYDKLVIRPRNQGAPSNSPNGNGARDP